MKIQIRVPLKECQEVLAKHINQNQILGIKVEPQYIDFSDIPCEGALVINVNPATGQPTLLS